MKKIFNFKIKKVEAHCDVPCGIYDPSTAQIAALSVIRMVDLINALEGEKDINYYNSFSRYITTKEQESIRCKNEINIIWGDFIKPAHVQQYPEIHTIVHQIMMLGSAVKQSVSIEKALELLEQVNKFTKIYWQIKEVATEEVTSPYLPNKIVVRPVYN